MICSKSLSSQPKQSTSFFCIFVAIFLRYTDNQIGIVIIFPKFFSYLKSKRATYDSFLKFVMIALMTKSYHIDFNFSPKNASAIES